jgi:hypothetical protein
MYQKLEANSCGIKFIHYQGGNKQSEELNGGGLAWLSL